MALMATSKKVIAAEEKFRPIVKPKPKLFTTCEYCGTLGLDAKPAILSILLAIMAVLGPGLTSLLIALGLTNWSYTCRIARASALSLRSQGYVQAATVLGYGDLRIMITQLLPNMLGPIVVIATLGMGSAVLSEAALSFLGLGIPEPYPSWGRMLSESAAEYVRTAPWLVIFPGIAISLAVFGTNLFGDALRDILDPRQRG